MRWRPTPVTAVLVPIALALVGNLATNTVQITAPWRPVVWIAVVLLIAVAVVSDRSRRWSAIDLHSIADELADVVRK